MLVHHEVGDANTRQVASSSLCGCLGRGCVVTHLNHVICCAVCRALISLTSWTGQEKVEMLAHHKAGEATTHHVDLAHDVIQGDFERDAAVIAAEAAAAANANRPVATVAPVVRSSNGSSKGNKAGKAAATDAGEVVVTVPDGSINTTAPSKASAVDASEVVVTVPDRVINTTAPSAANGSSSSSGSQQGANCATADAPSGSGGVTSRRISTTEDSKVGALSLAGSEATVCIGLRTCLVC